MSIASILIVEDEAIISLGIQDELEMLGYEVAAAVYKGEDALRVAETLHPDLVLMDINLRGKLDGIETAVQLHARYRLPIVFLTGAVDNATVQRAKVVEPYGYILKPFSPNDLRITIENALNKCHLEIELRQSEARFRELFETSLDGILITDLDGNILENNPAFQKILGYTADDLHGLKITQLTPPEYMLEENQMIENQVLVRGYSDEIFKDYFHQNSSRVPASLRIWVRKDSAGHPVGFWAIIRDIMLEKAAEQKIVRQAEFSQRLVKLTADLSAQLELPKVFEIMCAGITQALNVEAAQVTLFDPEKNTLAIAHTYGPIDAQEILQIPYSKEIYDEFFTHGQAYVIIPDVQDILEQHPYFRFLVKHNIRTAVIVNLNHESQLIGTLDLATIGISRQFDQEELTFLITFANYAAIAIDHARLYQQAKRRTAELEVLARLSAVLRLAGSRQEMLPILLKEVIGLTNADAGMIFLLGRAGNPIDRYPIFNADGQSGEWFIPSGALWGKALSSDDLVMDSVPELQVLPDGISLSSRSICSRVLIPIRSTDTLAAIVVLGFTDQPKFSEEDRRILLSLAEMGANALHRSGLMEMLEQRVTDRTRDLRTLYDLTVFVNLPVGLDRILEEALQKVIDTIAASCGIICYYNEKTAQLKLNNEVNLPGYLLAALDVVPVSAEMKTWMEKSATPWLARNGDGHSIPFNLLGDMAYDTIISIPIRYEGKTLGLLTVIWCDDCDLTAENIALLSAVAERLGSAIQNDILRQISKNAAVLEERQRLARELHDSVTQSLYSLTLLAEAGKDLLAREDLNRLNKCLCDLADNSIQALKEMRMLLFELRPPLQGEYHLSKALQDRLDAVERRAGVKAALMVDDDLVLPPGVQEELYRIASEALNNSMRHSGASSVLVNLEMLDDCIQMLIEDNGRGFDLEANHSGGMGLRTMQDRVERLGGVLDIWSTQGKGTRVTIKLIPPLE